VIRHSREPLDLQPSVSVRYRIITSHRGRVYVVKHRFAGAYRTDILHIAYLFACRLRIELSLSLSRVARVSPKVSDAVRSFAIPANSDELSERIASQSRFINRAL